MTPAEQTAASIRARLDTMQPGEALPSVREMAAAYGVSAATVQKALRVLKAEGLVVARQGWGTFKAG